MIMVTQENFRFRVDSGLKADWMGLCERKRISQQDAIAAVIEWVVAQDDLVQSLVFKQMAPESETAIAELALQKITGSGSSPAAGARASEDQPERYVRGAKKRDGGNRG